MYILFSSQFIWYLGIFLKFEYYFAEPGSYVPKTYKPNPLKNTPSPHKKETSPPKNVRFKKDGDARYGQAGQAVRDWAPDGPVKE